MEIFLIKYFIYNTKEIEKMESKKSTEITYELKYTGSLFESESPIYLHYGLENWSEISECKMRKLKNCYKTEVTVPSNATSLSFCFRDSNGNWDNNSGSDYWYTPSIGETYSCVTVAPVDCKTTTTKKTETKTCTKTSTKKTGKKDK